MVFVFVFVFLGLKFPNSPAQPPYFTLCGNEFTWEVFSMFGHIDKTKQRMGCQYFVFICRYGPGRRFFDSAGIVCVIRDLQSMIITEFLSTENQINA